MVNAAGDLAEDETISDIRPAYRHEDMDPAEFLNPSAHPPAFLPPCLPAFLPSCLPAFLPSCLPAFLLSCLPDNLKWAEKLEANAQRAYDTLSTSQDRDSPPVRTLYMGTLLAISVFIAINLLCIFNTCSNLSCDGSRELEISRYSFSYLA